MNVKRLASIDLRSLAAFRIMLGVMVCWDQFFALRGVAIFFSDDGVMPRLTMLRDYHGDPSYWCLHLIGGSVPVLSALLLLGIAAGMAVSLGWRTRWSVLLAWVLTISLQNRNPMVLHAGDIVLRMLLFWGLFLPLGACWSLDARDAPRKLDNPHFSIGSLAALMQVAFIYFFTGALKTGDDWLVNRSAVYEVLMADQFVRTPGLWLLPHEDLCKVLTVGVLWLEKYMPFLLFIPWRTHWWRIGIIVSMWLMHLGFYICIRVGPFPMLMATAWLLYVPGETWDWLGQRWKRLALPEKADVPAKRWSWQRIIAGSFCAVCLGIVLLWNLWSVNPQRFSVGPNKVLNTLAQVLRIDQRWHMFAPTAWINDGWFVLDAELYNGSHIDLLRDGRPLSFDKPYRISSEWPDWKWHKFQFNLLDDRHSGLRRPFGDYLASEWSRKHPRVRNWTFWFMREETLPHYQVVKPEKIELARNPMFVTK